MTLAPGLTAQAIALAQRHFGKAMVGADDGIPGRRTRAAIQGLPGGNLDEERFRALTGTLLSEAGDPDYGFWLRTQGIACEGWDVDPVRGSFVPKGIIIHHTGAWDGDEDPNNDRERIPPNRMIKGRTGLPGPIVQFGVSRDLSVDCYTNGRAHHAGKGDKDILQAVMEDRNDVYPVADNAQGNSWFLGIEVDHSGQDSEPPGPQWDKAAQVALALCKLWKWDITTRVIGHSDWTTRKTDPIYPMQAFEDVMAAMKRHGSYEKGERPRPPQAAEEFLAHSNPVDYAVVGGKRYRLVPDD